jgi:hypothetical protein
MIEIIGNLLIAGLATEALTNLLTKSEFSIRFIKKPLFEHRGNKFFSFLHDLLDCGYCTSVWAAVIPTIWFLTDYLDIVITILVLHRLSNSIHFLIDWLDEKRPRDLNYIREGEDYERLREEHDPLVGAHDEEISGPRTEDSSSGSV